jgi:large subunit ribosomal protein L25
MERVKLVVQQRDDTGSRTARRLRKQGLIPGVLYGAGKPGSAIAIVDRALYEAIGTEAGTHAVLDVTFEGQKRTHTVIVKDMQVHKVKNLVTHVDLQEIKLSDPIETTVTVQFEGTPHGVTMGGLLDITEHEVSVSGLPTDIPEHLTFNVEALDVGEHARIGDLEVPEGITILNDADDVLCTILAPKVVVEEAEEEAMEGVEGEAAEPEVVGKAGEGEGTAEE